MREVPIDMSWKVQLFGAPVAISPRGERFKLERRAAAMLAYLALEGATPKFQLAALLWPHPPAPTVRNNMRQLLRRLRTALEGEELVDSEEQLLQLRAGVDIDAGNARTAALARQHAAVLSAFAHGRELLAGMGFDDCPELARWLDGARAAIAGWHRQARASELRRSESSGDSEGALSLALSWVQAEPDSEEAGRELIRLYYLRGERSAALTAYERLKETLARELQVTPSAETQRLLREVERASSVNAGLRAVARPLPLSVQRPPMLAGREDAWRQLEDAWNAQVPIIFLSGEPGIGKSRLAEEFAERHGQWNRTGGRVGERDVPYAAHSRMLRMLLQASPGVQLAEWIRVELMRLLPELARPGETAPSLQGEQDLLRFYDANTEAMFLLHNPQRTMVIDDIQYWDAASSRLFAYALSRSMEQESPRLPRFIDCFRRHELPAHAAKVIQALVDAGIGRVIELEALEPAAVREMIAATGVAEAEALAERIARYTGGNPLYVVETLKHLLENDALKEGWPERLPPPGRVVGLIQRRMERLSPEAVELARVAALAGAQHSQTLAARLLQLPVSKVGQAAAELEAALFMMHDRFTHDLVLEAVQASIPSAVRRNLHAGIASALEAERAAPVLLARHWLESHEPERGLPFLLSAASDDERAMLPDEAATLYARAAVLLESGGRREEAKRLREKEAACRRAVQPRMPKRDHA